MQYKTIPASVITLALLASAGAAAAQSVGERLFEQNCASCHTADSALASRAGPGLFQVLGRKAGSVPGYPYSEAMAGHGAKGRVWTREELDAFLTDPAKVVPGTTMPIGVLDKPQRAAVIDYLAGLRGTGAAPAAPTAPAAAADRAGAWVEHAPGKFYHFKPSDMPAPFATPSAGNGPKLAPRPEGALPLVPAGFEVNLFAQDPDKARLPLRAPNGDIFLAQTAKGQISVLRSSDGKTTDTSSVFISGLSRPYGMAFYPSGDNPQYLYVANLNSVVRIPYRKGDLKARGKPETVVAHLSDTSGGHTTRSIAFSANGKTMLVSIGSATNIAKEIGPQPPQPLAQWEAKHGVGASWGVETDRATVMAFDPDGGNRRTFATGLRNCVGLLVHPGTGEPYCTVNERDALGDNLPPDYLTSVRQGGFYGWPWYYIGKHEDPRLQGLRPDLADKVIVPDVLFQGHSAPLGMAVYQAPPGATNAFPKEYEGDIFVALHGSWNRGIRTGYKVVRVIMKNGKPTGQYQDFMTGMVLSDRDVWGRPSGVEVAADGALLVVDDAAGVVWRIAPAR